MHAKGTISIAAIALVAALAIPVELVGQRFRSAPLRITTNSLPPAIISTSYTATLTASGGTSPYTWAMTTGTMVPGLTLNSVGRINGIPTAAGQYSFSVRVKDSAAVPRTATGSLTINVSGSSGSGSGSSGTSSASPPPQAAGYNLVFSDDFNSLNLSPNGLSNYTWYNPGMFWQNAAPSDAHRHFLLPRTSPRSGSPCHHAWPGI